jgi:hypothetical protein
MKKLTKIEMFERIMKNLSNPDEISFIAHEIELLENKRNMARKPTKVQELNAILKTHIVDFLTYTEGSYSIDDLQKNIPSLAELKNQKISALLTQLVNDNIIEKHYEKRKPYFKVKA